MEKAGLRIGVVTGIVGIRAWRIVVTGQQDHTGGTPMAERRDAGLTAVRILDALDTEFPRVAGERSVWTTGRIVLEPNAVGIIPGRAEITLSFRDLSPEVMAAMERCLHAVVQESNRRERCAAVLKPVGHRAPAPCDPCADPAKQFDVGDHDRGRPRRRVAGMKERSKSHSASRKSLAYRRSSRR